MVRKTFQRPLPVNAAGGAQVLGFSPELTEEITYVREVVDEFADALMADPIEHTVKCEDPLLRTELAARADEIFALEMKLRRVLSVIYLHAYPDADPYDLLREEIMQPVGTKPQATDKAAAENQFFHLTFGQYIGIRTTLGGQGPVAPIRNEDAYETLC